MAAGPTPTTPLRRGPGRVPLVRALPRRARADDRLDVVGHLDELRQRLFVVVGAIVVAFAFAYIERHAIIDGLQAPLPKGHKELVTFGVVEPFMTSLKVSAFVAFALASPIVFWQAWAFVVPKDDRAARRGIFWFTLTGLVLLLSGLTFGYFVALPAALHVLLNFDNSLYDVQLRASDYFPFATMAIAAVGVVFEMPLVLLALVRFNILKVRKLRANRRIGYVAMCVVGVALPGVDPITTVIETLPLLLLYEASIWAAVILDRKWHPDAEAEWAEQQAAQAAADEAAKAEVIELTPAP